MSGVRIPADIDRPDRILAGLTARQLGILATSGAVTWAAATPAFVSWSWSPTSTSSPRMGSCCGR